MAVNFRSSVDLNDIFELQILNNSDGLGLQDLFGAMGDSCEKSPKKESKLSSSKRNVSYGDTRYFNTQYRHCWDPFSDEVRDEDDFASELAHRAILSATMNEGDEEDFGLARPNDLTGRKPFDYLSQPKKKVVPLETRIKETQKYKKSPSKLDRKNRRSKNGQDPVEDFVYMTEDAASGPLQLPSSVSQGPSICLPLHTYKKMIEAEITAEGRFMQEYYALWIRRIGEEKDAALRSQIYWQDRAKKMEHECDYYADEVRHLRGVTDHLRGEIMALKEAKRRRRSAKKQRNRLSNNPLTNGAEGQIEAVVELEEEAGDVTEETLTIDEGNRNA